VVLPQLQAASSPAPVAGAARAAGEQGGHAASAWLPSSLSPPLPPWDPDSCLMLIRVLSGNPQAPMSWQGGGFSAREPVAIPMCESLRRSVPEPVALADLGGPQRGLVLLTPPALFLNRPAHGPLSHSLSAIAVVLVRAPYRPCLGKNRAHSSFPGRGSHRAPSQAAPAVRLPVPGEDGRWGKGSLGSSPNPSAAGRLFPASPQTLPRVRLGKQPAGFVRAVRTPISLLCSENAINRLWQEAPCS